jgi:hypothetical protein
MARITLALAFLLSVSVVFSAPIDGKWSGSVPDINGGLSSIVYIFKTENSVLTGTVEAGGMLLKLQNGKIAGNNISFFVDVNNAGKKMRVEYSGVVSPDSIKLEATTDGRKMVILVVRDQNMDLQKDNLKSQQDNAKQAQPDSLKYKKAPIKYNEHSH